MQSLTSSSLSTAALESTSTSFYSSSTGTTYTYSDPSIPPSPTLQPPNNGDDDTNPSIGNIGNMGIIVALVSFSALGFLCFFIFCIVRTFFKDIYSPRRALKSGRPPRLPKGFLGWIYTVWSVPESVLFSTVGLDGVMVSVNNSRDIH